ncbi:MAG: response regulator [Candidatus Peribacteraceae bacterium]|nr:response regulator [Candidatus Peribacteraceae bacterium]
MLKGNILIADDDPVLRGIYQKKFSVCGYSIRVAENGEEVLTMIDEEEPDILILDINMPVMNGFGVLERCPSKDRGFPILLLTNFRDEKNQIHGKNLGANKFIIKSDITLRKLLTTIESIMVAKQCMNLEESQETAKIDQFT